tara:strand:+ start:64 stop:1029 length:966 start_codon:yes stop_codon:yes gene_type:complete
MQLFLEDIKNSNLNIPALIIGSSKRMNDFPFSSFKGKIISIGDSIIRGKDMFKSDYWVAANNEFPVPNIPFQLKIINSFNKTKFFFSDTAAYDVFWTKSIKYLNKKLISDWLIFDDRHFNNKKCSSPKKCCNLITEINYNLTNYFINQFGGNFQPLKGNSVVEPALMLAMIMGMNPIFIQGVEIPLSNKDYTYYPSLQADKVLLKTRKYMARKYLIHYLLNGNLIKKISKSERIRNFFKLKKNKRINFNSSFPYGRDNNSSIFAKDFENFVKNMSNISKIGKENSFKIINVNKYSNLKYVEDIMFNSIDSIKSNYKNCFNI